MFGFLKKLFGFGCGNSLACKIDKLYNINIGDEITFQEMQQSDISGSTFHVVEVNYITFEHEQLPIFVMENDAQIKIFVIPVDDEKEEPFLMISRLIDSDTVEQMFNPDEYASLFEEGNDDRFAHLKEEPEFLKGWTAPIYKKCIDARPGHFYKGDYRQQMIEESKATCTPMLYTMLTDKSGGYVIDIIQFPSKGNIDVYVTIYESVSLIED